MTTPIGHFQEDNCPTREHICVYWGWGSYNREPEAVSWHMDVSCHHRVVAVT